MKSIDKFVLVLVASLALLLAGCGGGSSSMEEPTEPPAVDPAVAERDAINSAIMMARTAVPGIDNDSTDSEVSAADTAIANARAAIAAAANVPAEEKAANTATVDTLAAQLTAAKTARMAAMDAADEAMAKAMAETGKLLHAALGPNQRGTSALTNIGAPTLSSAGLAIDATAGAGALADDYDPGSVTLKAGDAAESLGSWMGMDYALTTGTGDAKVTNEARVYTNRGAPKSVSFADAGYTVATATSGDDINGYLTLDETDAATLGRIMGATFTHSGTQTHAIPSRSDALYIRGTYDGAPGEYRCTGACSSTNDGKGSPSALGGAWHFKPDSGAMVSQPDANYLYYGWWVSKDNDGGPTAASAFVGEVGDVDGTADTPSGETLTGSATYAGHAAGKFAMSNTLDGTGNGGHFTADAMLTAKFGAIAADNENGVTGTIDNFRLNDGDEDPGWSVTLNRSSAWAADGGITGPTSDATVWSVNGNKAPASGTWSGTMYDEMPGDPPNGDGSNIPTAVTGTFYSEFSTIGRMVGAFGAEKD